MRPPLQKWGLVSPGQRIQRQDAVLCSGSGICAISAEAEPVIGLSIGPSSFPALVVLRDSAMRARAALVSRFMVFTDSNTVFTPPSASRLEDHALHGGIR